MKTALALSDIFTVTASDQSLPIELPVNRSALGPLFAEAKFHRGAEIGVWEGGFAEILCAANPKLKLTCVDPWSSQPDYKEGKNDPARMDQAYLTARKRLRPYDCSFLKMTSDQAASYVDEWELDFCYIDGNHLFEHVLHDLHVWSMKVRKGGVICGHDYRARDKDKSFIQVKPAVDQFTKDRGISPWFILTGDKSASFLWVKA